MSEERTIIVSPSDAALFQKLQAEVGQLDGLTILEAEDAERWYNPDIESSEMAVRGLVRIGVLARLGFKGEDWIEEKDKIAGTLDNRPEVKSALGTPNYYHYEWQKVGARDMGSFPDMCQSIGSRPIIDAQKGVVLFSDEVAELKAGRIVTTRHASGLETLGCLAEDKEVYRVDNGNLQRVRAYLVD